MKRLYTLPSTRGRGVGKALIGEVIRVAVELGYDEMYLDTLPSLKAALGAYEKDIITEISLQASQNVSSFCNSDICVFSPNEWF